MKMRVGFNTTTIITIFVFFAEVVAPFKTKSSSARIWYPDVGVLRSLKLFIGAAKDTTGSSFLPDWRLSKGAAFVGSIIQLSGICTMTPGSGVMGAFANDIVISTTNNPAVRALESVERVADSLKFIEQDINNGGDAKSVVKQVKFLVQNYRLRDSVIASLPLARESQRKEAREHGISALEDLASIYEYFDEDINDMSGKRTPPREVLGLAQDALVAARKEFGEYTKSYPTEVVQSIIAKLKSESI